MKILILDNYDSFTYNLAHLVEDITQIKPEVFLNDQITLEAVGQFDKIILSPGPGLPGDSGIMMALIQKYKSSKSILGVCLGHQALAQALGGSLFNLEHVQHGIATPVHIDVNAKLFKHLPSCIHVGRYHSWMINPSDLPANMKITATDSLGQIMAIEHELYDLQGIQFHPESVLTPQGKQILSNWFSNG